MATHHIPPMYSYSRESVAPYDIVVTLQASPWIYAYRWTGSAFGEVHTSPTNLPVDGTPPCVAIAPNKGSIVCGGANSTSTAYKWRARGFGQEFTSSDTYFIAYDIAYSPAGDHIVTATGLDFVTPTAWHSNPWSDSTGFGTAAYPATDVGGTGYATAFAPDGSAVVAGHSLSPYVTVRAWSGGFGAKFSDPASGPGATVRSVRFNPSSDALVIGAESTPYLHGWKWAAGFSTKYSNPADALPGAVRGVSFSPSGAWVVIATTASPYLMAYAFSQSSGFGAKVADPADAVPGAGKRVVFAPGENYVAIVHEGSPFLSVYEWTGVGFGSKVSNPSDLPPTGCTDVKWIGY